MNAKQALAALYLVAAMASAARSQSASTPRLYETPVESMGPAAVNGRPPFYPTQVEQAYGLATLMGGTGTAAVTNNGAGQTVAIIDAYHYSNALSAINTFSAGYMGLWTLPQMSNSGPGPTFTQLNQTGGTVATTGANSGWNGEEALDIEYVHAMAPMANIILYEANSESDQDLFAAINAARNNPAVSVVSMSWSFPEMGEDAVNDSCFTTPGTKAAIGKNVTFCASTGDWGSFNESPGNEISGYPSSSPNVVAVGGTSLYLTTSGNYSRETAWSWNSRYGWAGGGGTSAEESQPAWQTSYGTAHPGNTLSSTTASRCAPDVSMISDGSTGVMMYDPANGGWYLGEGGTSLACPCFAGLIADADEMRANTGLSTLDGPSQTLPALYNLSDDFHDITTGNISPTGNASYSAGVGYDLATGLGSPIANELVPDLANYGVTPVPEPYTPGLLAAAALGLLAVRRRRTARGSPSSVCYTARGRERH